MKVCLFVFSFFPSFFKCISKRTKGGLFLFCNISIIVLDSSLFSFLFSLFSFLFSLFSLLFSLFSLLSSLFLSLFSFSFSFSFSLSLSLSPTSLFRGGFDKDRF